MKSISKRNFCLITKTHRLCLHSDLLFRYVKASRPFCVKPNWLTLCDVHWYDLISWWWFLFIPRMPISDESSTNSKTDWYPSGLSFLSIILFPACTHHWVVVGYIYHTPNHNSRKRNQVNSREWIYAQRIHGLFRAHVAKILGKPMSFISSFLLQWKHKSRKGSFPHNQKRYFLTDCLFLNGKTLC